MKRSFFLSTFLFAAVLSPITLQSYDCAPPPEARLSVLELRVGSFSGENTIEGFNPNVFSYDVRFPESESVGVLWVRTNHPSTKIDVEYDGVPVQLVGQSVAELDVPLGSSELTIHVTRLGPTPDSNTYRVRIQRGEQIPDIDLPEGFAAFVFYDGIPGPDGIVVVSNETLYVVNEFGPDGPFVLSAPRGGTYSTDDALSTIGLPLDSPDDLEAGEGNQLFIADGQAQTVFRLPQSGGEPIPFVTPATTGSDWFNPFGIEVVPPSFDGPSVDPGDLIVADNAVGRPDDRALWAVNQQTGLATVFVQGAVFEDGPLRAEFGPDGTLYVFQNNGSGSSRIVTVASDGTVIPFVEEIPARGALAVHPTNGDVYFTCGTGELCRVVYGTNTLEQFASNVGRFQSLEFSQSGLSLFVGATERDQVIEIWGDEQSWSVP